MIVSAAGVPVFVHAFLDGRDTPPKSAEPSLAALQKKIKLTRTELAVCAARLQRPQPRVALGRALRGIAHAPQHDREHPGIGLQRAQSREVGARNRGQHQPAGAQVDQVTQHAHRAGRAAVVGVVADVDRDRVRARPVQRAKASRMRAGSSGPPSASMRRAKARAASTNTGSLSPASAASGVFERTRAAQAVSLVQYESDDGLDGVWQVWACDAAGNHGEARAVLVDDSSAGLSWLVHGGDHGLRLRHEATDTLVAEAWLLLDEDALLG